jgi:hypothetical protein
MVTPCAETNQLEHEAILSHNHSVGIRHAGTDCAFNGNNLFTSLVRHHERLNKQNMSTVPFVRITDFTKPEAHPKGAGLSGCKAPNPPGPKLNKNHTQFCRHDMKRVT